MDGICIFLQIVYYPRLVNVCEQMSMNFKYVVKSAIYDHRQSGFGAAKKRFQI